MSFRVTLAPSGRSISVAPDETILEAALRDGHAVSYHCANGSCGDCRARIIEGKLADHLHHDFIFKGADRLQPMLLMCRAKPASDMTIEVQEAQSAEDIPHQEITATVVRRNFLTDDIIELHLRTPRSQTLRFLAGQNVALTINSLPPRNKSVASCPCNGRELQFHFRRSAGDLVTRHVFEELKLKDTVEISGPNGSFVMDDRSDRNILMIAFETGFAPVKSLIEHAISLELPVPIHLLWLARDNAGHYQQNYCRAWKDACDNFDYSLLTIDEDAVFGQPGHPALERVTDVIRPYVESSGDADIYLAVPENLFLVIQEMLEAYPVNTAHMVYESMKRNTA
jgi:CDP-4-dehydro-6-deoxyglucose reductase